MKRRYLIVLFMMVAISGSAQIRISTLNLQRKETYEIKQSDILVVDELIMGDSAHLILNSSKKDNYLHIKKMILGNGSSIIGVGETGNKGKAGVPGNSNGGPCKDGTDGKIGTPGGIGFDAVNLFLYVDEIEVKGSLIIDLTGGDGGAGGAGGAGGNGNRGTRVCPGGSGGNGAAGSAGGNGGHGGNLTITSPYGKELRTQIGLKIYIKSYGGFGGIGGDGGVGGQRGLAPLKDGEAGRKGVKGADGKAGPAGTVFLEQK